MSRLLRAVAPLALAALFCAYAGQAGAQQIFPFFRQPAVTAAPNTSTAARGDALGMDRQYDQATTADPDQSDTQLPPRLQRQIVSYPSHEAPGTIIIDTPHTYLYYVLGNGKAMRYGIGVGREGFTWSGVKSVIRKAEWPDWYPPPEMIKRQPYLPRMVAGGPGNPLGARAMYIGGTEYRIHGTNDPSTIGKHVSSGCIRLTNADVIDLFNRVNIGAKVIVLPQSAPPSVANPRKARLTWNASRPSALY